MKFTPEQIKQIEEAILDAHEYMDDDANLHLSKLANEVTAKLTKPEGKLEDDVMYASRLKGGEWAWWYGIWHKDCVRNSQYEYRRLTLAEHGPDVKAMQAALKRIASASARAGCREFAALVLKDHEIK